MIAPETTPNPIETEPVESTNEVAESTGEFVFNVETPKAPDKLPNVISSLTAEVSDSTVTKATTEIANDGFEDSVLLTPQAMSSVIKVLKSFDNGSVVDAGAVNTVSQVIKNK